MKPITAILETILLSSIMLLHLYLCPFTKVEESFNIQATHDLLYKPWHNLTTFDHLHFPGVVPRTFTGPLILTLFTSLPKSLLSLSPFSMLHLVRGTLGILTVLSLISIRNALCSAISPLCGTLFTLFTAVQFHILFYSSRTLPNTFALVLINLACAHRIGKSGKGKGYVDIGLVCVACALFRSELCLYIFGMLAADIVMGRVEIIRAVVVGGGAAVLAAGFSIGVDSYFWNRWSYPELEVFYYNTVLNKSSAWGTSAWHWYFSNGLPRALGGCYILAGIALVERGVLTGVLLVPAIVFVGLYSGLPHKELRFVFYVLPVLNCVAAVRVETACRVVNAWYMDAGKKEGGRNRNRLNRRVVGNLGIVLGFVATLFASGLQTGVSVLASRHNYPAGYAMQKMHQLEAGVYQREALCEAGRQREGHVHIDAYSAMTGISQFVQRETTEAECPAWKYSKSEADDLDVTQFSHLIWAKAHVDGFCVIHVQQGYAGLHWRALTVNTQPQVYVHRNKNLSTSGCAS